MIIGIDASRATTAVPTGTERYSREVITALLRIAPQHDYRLYVRDLSPNLLPNTGRGLAERSHDKGQGKVEVIPLGPRRLWTHIGLAREVAAHPPDALFIPAHVLPLPQVVWRSTRTVVTIHDVGYRYFPQAHPLRQRLYLDWSTALTARFAWRLAVDSEATQSDVQHFYHVPAAKLRVAYPGALPLAGVTQQEIGAVQAKFGLSSQQPYTLYVGTLQPRKNLRRLVEAWQVVMRTFEPQSPRLVIAGGQGWGDEDLPAEVRARGLEKAVCFTGYVSDTEKSVLMRGAKAFAFPSLYEGFGFPVLEAQSAGIPVVCSNTSSLPEVAGGAALLVDPLDVSSIAVALHKAMFDDKERAKLSQAGKRNVERFTWERCASIILSLLENA